MTPSTPIYITKEDGSTEEFVPAKLESSLLKAGAQPTMADKIVREIVEDLERGVCNPDAGTAAKDGGSCTVEGIYGKAFEMLKHMSMAAAARYSLKRSILEFGPTGFPFEDYIAEIFKAKGYETLTDQVVLGGCVPHEVDVVAWNDEKLIMSEVKYHHEMGSKTDLKVSLYVKARYEDIQDNMYVYGGQPKRKVDEFWLITNTKFTDTAITYANCKGLKLLSWLYPEKHNLLDMIEETKLHPITCLVSLTASDKSELLRRDVVLCKTVYDDKSILKQLGYSDEKIFRVIEEIGQIINLTPQE